MRFDRRSFFAVMLVGFASAQVNAAVLQAGFDLSPDKPGRIEAQPVPAAIAAIPKDFPLVRPGFLTVAVIPDGGPPLATYATDARTVVGADPGYARLVAEKLDLQPVAWADWPLGLASGKYDAVNRCLHNTRPPLAHRASRLPGAGQLQGSRPV